LVQNLGGTSLPETKGGTGQTTYTQGDLLYASGANTLGKLAKGTALHVLRMNAGATAPEWAAAAGGGGNWGTTESLTISTGAITPSAGKHVIEIDTEGAAATDDLDTFTTTNMTAGDVFELHRANDARITFITNDGNIETPAGRHYPIPPKAEGCAILVYDGTVVRLAACGDWCLYENITINFTSGQTSAQCQAIIDEQPKNLGGYRLTPQFGDGTYSTSFTSALTFADFYNGELYIYGNTGESETLHTNQAVHLDFSAGTSSGIIVRDCVCEVRVMYFKIELANSAVRAIDCVRSQQVRIGGNYLLADGKSPAGIRITDGSIAEANANYVNNLDYGLQCIMSRLYSNGNDDTGTAPNYGLRCEEAGVIGKNGTQPAGTTSAESTTSGGAIR
jgi:hypothetical protein